MATQTWLDHAAELCATTGPTGEYVRVLAGEVRDAGGNVLFSGTADECVREAETYRIHVGCWPTKWERVSGEVGGADNQWNLAVN